MLNEYDSSSAYTNGGIQPDSSLLEDEFEVEDQQFDSLETNDEVAPSFYGDYGFGAGSRKLLTLPTDLVNCTTRNVTTNVVKTTQVQFQNCTGNVTLLQRVVLPTDLVNCTTRNVTTNVVQTTQVQWQNCTGNVTFLPVDDSGSSTGSAPPTGVWSCTPYTACGFYPTCTQSRNCKAHSWCSRCCTRLFEG